MRVLKFGFAAGVIFLSGCLEPQPAPEINQRPSAEFNLTTLTKGLDSPWSVARMADI